MESTESVEKATATSQYVTSTFVNSAVYEDSSQLNTRMSLRELMNDSEKLNSFLRAWKRIKQLHPDNPNSFWTIAGYHGMPFVPNQIDPELPPDGYCQHRNVLFPIWHRFYVLRLEQALQAVCPGENVCMHFWDETSEDSLKYGIPSILTDEKVYIDGVLEDNPIKTYIFQKQLGTTEMQRENPYFKPKGYSSKRYPFAGIENDRWRDTTNNHNDNMRFFMQNEEKVTEELNKLIVSWLTKPYRDPDFGYSTAKKYEQCLNTSTYTAFSNKVSADESHEVSLEQPHDDIHVAIGGGMGEIHGTSGDMQMVETAGFDPIFYFHHCFVDRVFWLWQVKHGATEDLEIDPEDPGATVKNPTPYQQHLQKLTMDTRVHPFQLSNGLAPRARDGVNIEQLNYRYAGGSLEDTPRVQVPVAGFVTVEPGNNMPSIAEQIANGLSDNKRVILEISGPMESSQNEVPTNVEEDDETYEKRWELKVENFKRDVIRGSFVMALFWFDPHNPDAGPELVGRQAEFRRWDEALCANCETRPKDYAISFDVTDCAIRNNYYITTREFSIKVFCTCKEGNHNFSSDVIEDAEQQTRFRLFRIFAARQDL